MGQSSLDIYMQINFFDNPFTQMLEMIVYVFIEIKIVSFLDSCCDIIGYHEEKG